MLHLPLQGQQISQIKGLKFMVVISLLRDQAAGPAGVFLPADRSSRYQAQEDSHRGWCEVDSTACCLRYSQRHSGCPAQAGQMFCLERLHTRDQQSGLYRYPSSLQALHLGFHESISRSHLLFSHCENDP